jgi:hypothetical protein
MSSDAAPVLSGHFADAAIVAYTNADGDTTLGIDAVLGDIREVPMQDDSGVFLESMRTVDIETANLETVDTNGKFTIAGEDWGVHSKAMLTPTWWRLELIHVKRREIRGKKIRDV